MDVFKDEPKVNDLRRHFCEFFKASTRNLYTVVNLRFSFLFIIAVPNTSCKAAYVFQSCYWKLTLYDSHRLLSED
jgi:hypothetical protein